MTLPSKLIKCVFGPSFQGCWDPLERPLATLGRSWRPENGLWGGPTALLDSGKVSGPELDPIWDPKLSFLGVPFWA